MSPAATAPLGLTLLLAAAVFVRAGDLPRQHPVADSPPASSSAAVILARTGVDGVEAVAVRVPWCSRPVGVVFVPAWLSTVDIRALSWPGEEAGAATIYAGMRLPERGVNGLIAAMRLGLRLARALRLVSADTAGTDVLKLFAPSACRDEAEILSWREFARQAGRWRMAARRDGALAR